VHSKTLAGIDVQTSARRAAPFCNLRLRIIDLGQDLALRGSSGLTLHSPCLPLLGEPIYRHCLPVRLSLGGCSFQGALSPW
jgi:hypothetical protein